MLDAFTCAALITLAFAFGGVAGSIFTLNWIKQGGLHDEGFRYSYFWNEKLPVQLLTGRGCSALI